MDYIKVMRMLADNKYEIVEVPLEDDATLPLATIASQFPGFSALKYRDPETHSIRTLPTANNCVAPPTDGWGDHTYLTIGVVAVGASKRPAGSMVATQATGKSEPCERIFVGNLPFSLSGSDTLKSHFPSSTNIDLPLHADSGKIKGFAYITFTTTEAAEQAMTEQAELQLEGRKLSFDFAPFGGRQLKRPKSDACPRLYVGNLPFSIANGEALRPYFEGAVDIQVPSHADTGRIKGFGYITFASTEAAEAVMKANVGLEIDSRMVRLDFAPFGVVGFKNQQQGGNGGARGGGFGGGNFGRGQQQQNFGGNFDGGGGWQQQNNNNNNNNNNFRGGGGFGGGGFR